MKRLIFTLAGLAMAPVLFAQTGQQELSTRYNQYGVRVDRNLLTAEERGGILVFESLKQDYKLWFDARVQVDGAYFFGQSKDYDPIGSGLTLRRVRFAVKAQVTPDWYGEIDMDIANGVFELKDALIRYDGLCHTSISLGNMKEDFCMSEVTTSRYLSFMERPMIASVFAPGRHLGLDVNFQRNWFYMSVGTFFQLVESETIQTMVEDQNKDFGRSTKPDYTARMVFTPFYKWHMDNKGLHVGGGATYRQPQTSDEEGWRVARYSTRNATNINRKKYIDTDVLPNKDYEFRYGGELAGWYNGLRFQGEYIQNDLHRLNNLETLSFYGWYAEVGHTLFGGRQRYDESGAKFTQPTRGRSWGDIELMARYDFIDLNDKTVYGGSGENYTFGINYYVNNNVKVVFNYQYTNNDRYANGKGKLFVGHDANGNPTKDYRAVVEGKGKAGVDYNMVGMRFEIDF